MAFLCCICGLQKEEKVKLEEHIRREHSDTRIVFCKICDKEFERMKKLSNHMRIHQEVSYKKSEMCQKEFKAGSYFNHVKLPHC